MRIFLPIGKHMAEHAVDGPVTLQCIEGEIDVVTGNTHKVIRSADMLYLAAGVPHELRAIRNSSLLVTVVLLRTSDKPGIASQRRVHHDNALQDK